LRKREKTEGRPERIFYSLVINNSRGGQRGQTKTQWGISSTLKRRKKKKKSRRKKKKKISKFYRLVFLI
jgi:hypothetical protein